MLRDFIARIRVVAVALVAAAAGFALLASCGVKGPLKLPPASASTPAAGVPAPEAQPAQTVPSGDTSAPKPPETRP
jgi:predicted small lipoprotein YifL